jgi:predicted nucleic acid-binding protein
MRLNVKFAMTLLLNSITKKIFIDTSAFYALIDRSDQYHEQAKELWPDLLDDRTVLMTSSCVVFETIGLLQSRIGFQAARLWYSDMLGVVDVRWVDQGANRRANDLWQNLGSNYASLNDCVSFVIMRSDQIQTIFCFKTFFDLKGFHVLPVPIS